MLGSFYHNKSLAYQMKSLSNVNMGQDKAIHKEFVINLIELKAERKLEKTIIETNLGFQDSELDADISSTRYKGGKF